MINKCLRVYQWVAVFINFIKECFLIQILDVNGVTVAMVELGAGCCMLGIRHASVCQNERGKGMVGARAKSQIVGQGLQRKMMYN